MSKVKTWTFTHPLQPTFVCRMKALETTGPNPDAGRHQMYSQACVKKRYFMGTSSLDTIPKLSCVEAAREMRVMPPMRILIVDAVATIKHPRIARTWPEIKNQRRLDIVRIGTKNRDCWLAYPKRSLNRPTKRSPIARAIV
jgi:hypothetical protein